MLHMGFVRHEVTPIDEHTLQTFKFQLGLVHCYDMVRLDPLLCICRPCAQQCCLFGMLDAFDVVA